MAKISLVDTSFRDGNQSLWGATGLTTPQMLEIAPILDRVGFRALDFAASSHMGVAVRNFRENPWERFRLMRAAMPNTKLQFIGTGLRFISWETAEDDFMRLVYRRMVANGIDRFIVLDPMLDRDAMLQSARMMREVGGEEIIAALTFTISAIHDDALYAELAGAMAQSPDVDRVYIKDPAGLLSPERARTLIAAICGRLGGKALELHSHCTIGLAPLTYLTAAELGVDALHVGIGPLSNGTAHPPAARIVANLRELGHTVDIDDKALARVGNYLTSLAKAEGLPFGTPQEFDAAFLRHQIPGGVITTLKRQLAEVKHEDRLPAVIEEVGRVREELGYPIMVTPFPQIVCTQAFYNVIGKERYENVPDQLIRYVIGRFGRPTAPVDADVMDRILSRPRARELMAEPPPLPLAELRRKFPGVDDDEFLLRAVMPGDLVDAMLAAPAVKVHYNPDCRPIARLVHGLAKREDTEEVIVEKPGFRLELRKHQPAAQ